ncbi:hypothetical protein JB92DRAFT_3121759 [Gautieria morchelliformis]|nr:hypothetical protein JB92DRAFT_3121759 [Gautieria morchelliformis]
MPSNRSSYSSDSEDEAPEVLTLSATRDFSRTQSEAIHAVELAQKAKRKRENRERDAALKEAKEARAEGHVIKERGPTKKKTRSKANAKGKKEHDLSRGEEMSNAEERMARAMREAAEEESGGDSADYVSDEWHGIANEQQEWQGITDPTAPAATRHLPDHMFFTAGTHKTTISSSSPPSPKPRKKRKKSKAKELIVGSRVIRTLPSAHPDSLTASLTRPPARINRFLKRTLKLRKNGGSEVQKNKNSNSWERRPANLGVMRHTTGPAMRFARSATV